MLVYHLVDELRQGGIMKILLIITIFWVLLLTLVVLNNDTQSVRRDTKTMDNVISNAEDITTLQSLIDTNQKAIIDLYGRINEN